MKNTDLEIRQRLAREVAEEFGSITRAEWATIEYRGLVGEYKRARREKRTDAWEKFRDAAESVLDAVRFHRDYEPEEAKREKFTSGDKPGETSGGDGEEPSPESSSGRTVARSMAADAYNRLHAGEKELPSHLGIGATLFPRGASDGTIPQLVCLIWTDVWSSPEEVKDFYSSVRESCLKQSGVIEDPAEVLVNPVNTRGGAEWRGALEFKRAFPDNHEAYAEACERGDIEVGKVFVFDRGDSENPRYIINFPIKRNFGEESEIEYIKTGLEDLTRQISDLGIKSIAFPTSWWGNDGLSWKEVRPLLEDAESRSPGVMFCEYGQKKRATRIPQRSFELARFVWEAERSRGKRPSWPELMKRWNESRPEDGFNNRQNIQKTFKTAERDILDFPKSMEESFQDWLARGGEKEAFDAWAKRFRDRLWFYNTG